MLLSLWKKLNFISCPFFPPPRSWLFKRRLKAKQRPSLELSVYLDVCHDEHSLIGCWPWVSTVSMEALSCLLPWLLQTSSCPQLICTITVPSITWSLPVPLRSILGTRSLWRSLSCLQALSYSLGLHCLLETPAVSAQEVGLSILTMHPGLSMCPLPPCLYHQPRSFLASRRSPFFP